MSIKQTIQEDMKKAMKARDSLKLNTLRLVIADLKNVEIDHGEQDEKGVEKVIARLVKQMKEAVVEYKKGNRQDLVDEEEQKVKVLEVYLPEQMSDEKLEAIVQEVVDQAGEKAVMGPIIGQVIKKTAGQADSGRVAQMVKQVLS